MWLDSLRHNYIDGNGNVKIGLQLILLKPDHPHAREYCNVTGGDCMNWKKTFGVLVTLRSEGVPSLEGYFKKKRGRKTYDDKYSWTKYSKINDDKLLKKEIKQETLNKEWCITCSTLMDAPNGLRYRIYPQIDLNDLSVIQKGLMGVLWDEIKYPGIPGLRVDKSITVAMDNEEAWINVWVSKAFNECTNGMYDALLPCSAILTWDNSI